MGGDYYRTDSSGDDFRDTSIPSIDIFNPVHTPLIFDPATESSSDDSTDFYGLYAQDQIELPYDVHVMGGLRYQNVKQRNNLTDKDLTSDDAVTPHVGALWQPQPWVSLYGSYVENFGASNEETVSREPLPPESAQRVPPDGQGAILRQT